MNTNILLLRKSLGLTQKEFGEKIYYSRDQISNIELGRVKPDTHLLSHICIIFNVNEDWLRSGKGDMLKSHTNDLSILFKEKSNDLSDNMKSLFRVLLTLPSDKQNLIDEILDTIINDRMK